MLPVVGYVGAGSEVFAIDDHEKGSGIDEIEAPAGMLNGIAVIVRGASMEPKYSDGEVLFIEKTVHDLDSLIGSNCYIQTADGRSYVTQLHYGSTPGMFTLISYNAPPIENVVLERVYPIAYTKPRYRNLK
jgi:phage repressor protein C with HTH and peptisase S24 domain